MDSQAQLTIKGIPMYIVAFFSYLTDFLPTIILWLTFLYGAIQLFLVLRQLWRDYDTPSNLDAE
jgi:hypothetical protein